jgi:hypothetical protein
MSLTYGTVTDHRTDTDAPRYGYPASGYGRKIPTRHWVRLTGDTRWRRVYVMQYGNAGSPYVVVRGEDVFLNEHDLA